MPEETETVEPMTLEQATERRDQVAQALNVEVPRLQAEFHQLNGYIAGLQAQTNGHATNGAGPNRAQRRARPKG